MALHAEVIDDVLRVVNGWINDKIAQIAEFIGDLITPVTTAITGLINSIKTTIEAIVSSVVSTITSVFNTIVDTINAFINNTLDYIEQTFNMVIDSISNLVAQVWDDLVITFNAVVDAIDSIMVTAVSSTETLFNQVANSVTEIVDDVLQWLNDAFTTIVNDITDIIDAVIFQIDRVIDNVAQRINDTIAAANEMVISIEEGVQRFITEVIDVAGVTLRELIATVADLPDVLSDMGDTLVESAKTNIAEPLGLLGEEIAEALGSMIMRATDDDQKQVNTFIELISNPATFAMNSIDDLRAFIDSSTPLHNVLKTLLFIVLSPLLIMSLMQGINSINAKRLMYDYAETTPHEMLTPADYVDAKRRNILDPGDFERNLKRLGYGTDSIETLGRLGASPLPVNDLIIVWLRGLIDDEQFAADLIGQGIRPSDVQLVRSAASIIPPITDLITMAVREVFSPEVAAAFGQFDDFPDDVVEHGEKQGLSREWMQRYWAAHWALPSPQMGFEMMHRRIIDQNELTSLLKALDVMPFWRDRIIQLSFNPLTRVDVRRMHRVGVLTLEQVFEAYLDLGYSDENARQLAEFVERVNSPPPADDEVELQTLSKGNVLSLYDDGILDRNTALRMLAGLNYSPDASELLLASIDIDRQREERRDILAVITERFNAQLISINQAVDELNRAGLEPVEVERASLKMQRALQKRVKIPSKSDLDKFLANNLITDTEYNDNMRIIGYADRWINKYRALIKET